MDKECITQDDTQTLLVKMAKKFCRHMTASSLMKVHKFIEKTLDLLCPEWRRIK